MRTLIAAPLMLAAIAATPARAADIYVTNFDNYSTGTLSGQLAWIGSGTWAVSGAVNSPQIAANVIGPGVDPGINPVGGSGRMVRLCTERFNAGRTKGWLDLLNSGKWAAASAGGNGVLETTVSIYVPSGQALASGFGVMVSKSSFETAGGFVVSAQTGAISFLNNGYALANRVPVGASVSLNAWHEFTYRWNVATGAGELLVDGQSVGTHVTTLSGSVYASNLLAVTDATPGAINAFGYFDSLAIRAVPAAPPPPPPCPADLDDSGAVDGADLGTLLGAWGTPAADLDGDSTTGGADLGILLGAWGACPA
jgi:hypothetical protein